MKDRNPDLRFLSICVTAGFTSVSLSLSTMWGEGSMPTLAALLPVVTYVWARGAVFGTDDTNETNVTAGAPTDD